MQRKQISFSAGCTNTYRHSSARPASSDTEEKGRIEEITERGNTEEENGRKREVEVQERKMRNKIGKKSFWEFWVNHGKPGSPLQFHLH